MAVLDQAKESLWSAYTSQTRETTVIYNCMDYLVVEKAFCEFAEAG